MHARCGFFASSPLDRVLTHMPRQRNDLRASLPLQLQGNHLLLQHAIPSQRTPVDAVTPRSRASIQDQLILDQRISWPLSSPSTFFCLHKGRHHLEGAASSQGPVIPSTSPPRLTPCGSVDGSAAGLICTLLSPKRGLPAKTPPSFHAVENTAASHGDPWHNIYIYFFIFGKHNALQIHLSPGPPD